MDAEFYCLRNQQDLAAPLVNRIGRLIDESVALKTIVVDESSDWNVREEIGRRFSQLLLASVPPERMLRIEAIAGVELFGQRIYLSIYWPMLAERVYFMPAYGTYGRETYWQQSEAQFHGGKLEFFFPSLAIGNQMVLVPTGQNSALEVTGAQTARSLQADRPVIEVDFTDDSDMTDALTEVGEKLKRQLREDLTAYQSFRRSQELDIDGASAYLGVTPNMLQRVLQEDAVARNLVYHQLRCTIEPADLVQNVQTRVTLQVENPSEANLGQVLLHVRGPRTGLEINPDRVDLTLNSHTVLTVDLSMAALREGDFAVEVLILQQNTEVPSSSLPVHHLWIHASRPRGTSS